MALIPGTRVGPYEIIAALGAGGMGEVYRARDTKLNRDVALKVLPDSLASDPDRLARFQREAQVLASLNHPNIAHIHGLEENGGTRALVMELVDGEDLAQRLTRGAITIDEALPIAKQIAEALEAAHEQGIIHRDLKPANIKIRPDGTVKVLDFGLAKAMEPVASAPSMSQSPTITTPAMTQAGMILGTAAYMSPEQARGKPVDKRTDVWAFGAVLYEMLAGAPPFDGEDTTEVIAAVVKTTPNWAALPADAPAPIVTLIQCCLEKDRKARVGDIAVARFLVEHYATLGASTTAATNATRAPRWRRALPWTVAAALAAGLVTVVVLWAPWHSPAESAPVTFDLQTAATPENLSRMLALSPDGRHVVTPVQDGAVSRLWVRPLARLDGTMLARTDGAVYPFWSPDGNAVGFFADGKVKTVELSGASPQTIADDVQAGYGGTWNKAGVILFARQFDAIYRVEANGQSAVPVTKLDATRGDVFHRYPHFLPDGVHFLYLVRSSNSDADGIYVASLESTETYKLVNALSKPEFSPPDLLLFARESTLMAQRLDTTSFRAIGAPFRVVEPMSSNTTSGSAAFSVSDNGLLAYRIGIGGDIRDLAWVDRSGGRRVNVGTAAGFQNPRLSPDRKRLAVFKSEGGGDVWITELERGISQRFTLDPASDNTPLWSPDGTRIAFVSNRNGGVFDIYQKNAGGTGPEELLLKTPRHKQLNDWSPDDRYLVYEEDDPQAKTDLWMLPLGGDRKPSRLLATPFNESEAALSPDGHWMAYTSDESGSRQVYVQKFPISDRKWPVSSGRVGAHAHWSPQGDELFFDGGGIMFAVSVTGLEPGGELKLGTPKRLFDGLLALSPHNFDVADAERFLVLRAPVSGTGETTPITIVVNWQSTLSLAR